MDDRGPTRTEEHTGEGASPQERQAESSELNAGAAFVLWRREPKGRGRSRAWEMYGTFPSEREAWAQMKGSADWLVLPAGQQP